MVCCVDKSVPGWLDARNFATVLAAAPLIAIDLVVENNCGEYLLGLRKNAPAQDWCGLFPVGEYSKEKLWMRRLGDLHT